MNVLVVGSGGREHALVWKLHQSPQVERLWCSPGSDGIGQIAECIPGNISDISQLCGIACRLKPDITIVGPEQPLVLGIADEFSKQGLPIIGPTKSASRLEGSKAFAKEFMLQHGIPTASTYGTFESSVDAYTALCQVDWPMVIKADGLCGGKGVLVTSSPDEATAFVQRLMEEKEFGDAGCRVLLEEGLSGREISYIVLTDGENYLPMAAVQDYKRAFDQDKGPNTGGMGAISKEDLISSELDGLIRRNVVEPTITGMAKEGYPYFGFLYFGLMITTEGPKVLEFNCRLGDPETQALVMRMNFDLADTLESAINWKLANFTMNWSPKASASVVLAASGYPGKPKAGSVINGLDGLANATAFHAGTICRAGIYYVSSGRVLAISASGDTLGEAHRKAYDGVKQVSFEGMHYRMDIGRDELEDRRQD